MSGHKPNQHSLSLTTSRDRNHGLECKSYGRDLYGETAMDRLNTVLLIIVIALIGILLARPQDGCKQIWI